MNKRFRELAKQAQVNLSSFQFSGTLIRYEVAESELEKFAESIVQECAYVAHNKQYKHSPAHTIGDCATAIKQHFGVEQ